MKPTGHTERLPSARVELHELLSRTARRLILTVADEAYRESHWLREVEVPPIHWLTRADNVAVATPSGVVRCRKSKTAAFTFLVWP